MYKYLLNSTTGCKHKISAPIKDVLYVVLILLTQNPLGTRTSLQMAPLPTAVILRSPSFWSGSFITQCNCHEPFYLARFPTAGLRASSLGGKVFTVLEIVLLLPPSVKPNSFN